MCLPSLAMITGYTDSLGVGYQPGLVLIHVYSCRVHASWALYGIGIDRPSTHTNVSEMI